MKTLDITIAHTKRQYPIYVGSGLLENFSDLIPEKNPSSVFIITDSHVKELYLEDVIKQLKKTYPDTMIYSQSFLAGEQSKNLDTVKKIYDDMAQNGIDRSSLVVNLGGGVVTDIGGFAAATYMRGVPFINISTTLEGMVDASVGGKTGVNLGHLKNYVGVFSQPVAVIADTEVLQTLPERAYLQGYAEVIKHGLIADSELFQDAIVESPLQMDSEKLVDIVTRSIKIKALIVQEDEKEKAARKLLNFGHTVGHVLESFSFKTDDPLYHGEAVAIGMVAEAYLSLRAGMISQKEFGQIEQGIKHVGLPTRYHHTVSVEEVLEGLKHDKKNQSGKIKWTLLMGIGVGEFNISIAEKFVKEAIEYVLK